MNTLLTQLKELKPLIGNTPLHHLSHTNFDLYAKLESYNLMNNIKIRPAYKILQEAIKEGEVNEHTTIIESSSGNFGISLAFLCNKLNLPFIPVVDPNINPFYESFLKRFSHHVEKVTTPDDTGGFLLTRLNKIKELRKEDTNFYWTNQYSNEHNFLSHYEGIGTELIDSNVHIDYVFIATSTCGTISGISTKIKERYPKAKVIAVDVNGSVTFNSPPRKRFIPGIGASIKSPLLKLAIIDEVIHVEEIDGIESCHNLFNSFGIFAGGSSGCVYSAICNYFSGYSGSTRPNVLAIFADSGTPYLDTIYNPEWINKFFNKTYN